MNEADYNLLLELSWRRGLTATEAARLREHFAAHPEAREDWENEAQLSQLLNDLPEAPPVASNFTALVMQAVERETALPDRAASAGWSRWLLSAWTRRTAATCLVLGIGLVAYHEHTVQARETMGRKVAALATAVSASSPDLIEHFDTICRLSDEPPKADTELLASMK